MRTVEQYRKFAQDCRRMASAANNGERAALLQIAAAWEMLAAQREAQVRGSTNHQE